MFQKIRKHLTPSTFIAFLALVFALTGGAFAASSHGGGSGAKATASTTAATAAKSKAKPKAKTGPRGPAGPKGATGALGATGAAGATGATGPAGAQGPAGANGTNGEKGEAGAIGATGPQGATGATGATGPAGPEGNIKATLPSGSTETGVFSAQVTTNVDEYEESVVGVPISFSIPLAKPLGEEEVGYVTTAEQKKEACTGKTGEELEGCEELQKKIEASCPGNVEEPTAAKGHLCVYEGGTLLRPGEKFQKPQEGTSSHNICPPSKVFAACSEGYEKPFGPNGTGTSGAIMEVQYVGPEDEKHAQGAILDGSWAVTAP